MSRSAAKFPKAHNPMESVTEVPFDGKTRDYTNASNSMLNPLSRNQSQLNMRRQHKTLKGRTQAYQVDMDQNNSISFF